MTTPTIVAANPSYQRPSPLSRLWNLDGIAWWAARPPLKWHRHWAQSVAIPDADEVWRCACGAFGAPNTPWVRIDKRRRR